MHIAIAGATGAVGQELCSILGERRFKPQRITCLASPKSAGAQIDVAGHACTVHALTPQSFAGVDLALFALDATPTREHVPHARQAGAIVVDNSSAFRMAAEVPLVIPEINRQDLQQHQGIIANPNCSTIVMGVALWPLYRANRIRRIVVSTYQAVSGAGAQAMQELKAQTAAVLAGQAVTQQILPHPCAFNVFSHDSTLNKHGDNEEEVKMVAETRKIFHDQSIQISATCVRVPVLRAHSESINLQFEKPMSDAEARALLSEAPGIRVVDDRERNYFPMPVDASGRDEILVGRIRPDSSDPSGCSLNLFVCGDQLRKGAALNAIQIMEYLLGVQGPEDGLHSSVSTNFSQRP